MGCGNKRITNSNYELSVYNPLQIYNTNNLQYDPSLLIDIGMFKYGQYEIDKYENFVPVSNCNCNSHSHMNNMNNINRQENRNRNRNRNIYNIVCVIIIILIIIYFMRK